MSRKQKENSFEIKLEAVKLYLEKNIGSTTIAKELGLTDGRRVMLWVKRVKMVLRNVAEQLKDYQKEERDLRN